jgi:PAS domain-containing protein
VTERVEQRQQAEELARRLEAASHAAGIGLWTTRSIRRDRLERADLRHLRPLRPPAVPELLEWLGECVHPDDRERVAGNPCLPGAVHRRQEIEFRILRRDGSVRWVVMRADARQRLGASAAPRRGDAT